MEGWREPRLTHSSAGMIFLVFPLGRAPVGVWVWLRVYGGRGDEEKDSFSPTGSASGHPWQLLLSTGRLLTPRRVGSQGRLLGGGETGTSWV